MKRIPNIITVSRIILSIIILLINPNSIMFIVLYIACGLSDIVDGFIARKFSLQSVLGAKLDSIADMVFLVVVFIKFLPIIKVPSFIISWIMIIAIIRVTSLLIVRLKYRTFAVLHTYLNKLTGITLLLFPLAYKVFDVEILASLVCIIASIAALEEIIIHLFSTELLIDTKGICIKSAIRKV